MTNKFKHGDTVTAMTHDGEDHEGKKIKGTLEIRHVDLLNYDNHVVNGHPVDPETIEVSNV